MSEATFIRQPAGKARHLVQGMLLVVLGTGPAVAQQAAAPAPAYPAYPGWTQPGQPMTPPAEKQGEMPPPGPYAGQARSQAFAPQWPAQRPMGMGMTREEFQKQQAERHAAMEKRMAQMPQPKWPTPAESREEMAKRMAEMRERRQAFMARQDRPVPAMSREDHQKRVAEMKTRHEARWKDIESRQQEMAKLWEQMQAKEKEIQKQFEQMREEHLKHLREMGMVPPVAAAEMPKAAPRPVQPMPRHGYPAPYGYAPWQRPMPYGPAR